MKTNLVEKVTEEFRIMSFNEKILFLKEYKAEVERLSIQIKNYTEINHKGNKNSMINELLKVIPEKFHLDKRTYYIKATKSDTYKSFDLQLIIAFSKILENRKLTQLTYRLIVFMQKNILWGDCQKLGIAKTHFNNYWHFHPQHKSLYRLVRLNDYWPYLIDLICDVYSFMNYVANYHDSFIERFKTMEDPNGPRNQDYPVAIFKLDPFSYSIEFI